LLMQCVFPDCPKEATSLAITQISDWKVKVTWMPEMPVCDDHREWLWIHVPDAEFRPL
jgi:hypothetical protein